MDTLLQDLKYGIHMLFAKPGFTVIAVLTLALGIGANTAIFTVVNGVLLRSLPFSEPDRLVVLWANHSRGGDPKAQMSFPDFSDVRGQSPDFDEMAAMIRTDQTLSGDGEPVRLSGLQVSPGFFHLLGVRPSLGRDFLPEEEQEGKDHVVILSNRLWVNRYGSDSGIIGRPVTLDSSPYTVIGVMPAGYDLEFPATDRDLWTPLSSRHELASSRQIFAYEVLARLKPGITAGQTRASLSTIGARLEQEYPESNTGRAFYIVPLHEELVGSIRTPLLLLLAAVGMILLIACANLASLLLTRATTRQKELAIRSAMGATRGRLLRQLITESLLLALAGGLAGLLLAAWAGDLLLSAEGVGIPRLAELTLDGRVLTFTIMLSVLTGVLFGIVPAWSASRINLTQVLKDGGRTGTSGGRARIRGMLVVGEIALAHMLLIGAGLLIASFIALLSVNPGFDGENVLTFKLSIPSDRYPTRQAGAALCSQAAQRIGTLPEAKSVGVVSSLPLGGQNTGSSLNIKGRPLAPGDQPPTVGWQFASPGYFGTVGIPLVKGRDFTRQDISSPQHVIIIDETTARRFFPNEDPVGQRILCGTLPATEHWHEIIGVVGSVRHIGLDVEPIPRAYDLMGQSWEYELFFAVKTTGDPARLSEAARAQIHGLDASIVYSSPKPLAELASGSLAPRRFLLLLTAGMAGLALALATIGIYGVMSHSVSQRTREIGIRKALGARHGDLMRMVLGQGMLLTFGGVSIGLAAAFGLTRLMSSLLYGVTATNGATFVMAPLVLTAVAVAACYLPARRAARIDPMISLRSE